MKPTFERNKDSHYFSWDRYQDTQEAKGAIELCRAFCLVNEEAWQVAGFPCLVFREQQTRERKAKEKSRHDKRSEYIQCPDCKIITI